MSAHIVIYRNHCFEYRWPVTALTGSSRTVDRQVNDLVLFTKASLLDCDIVDTSHWFRKTVADANRWWDVRHSAMVLVGITHGFRYVMGHYGWTSLLAVH